MDPVTMILTALAAGIAKSAGELASEEVPKAYHALKKMVIAKLQGEANMDEDYANLVIEGYEKDPDSGKEKSLIEKNLQKTTLTEDDAVVQQARALLDLVDNLGGAEVETTGIEITDGSSLEGVEAKVGDTKISGAVKKVTSRGIKISGSNIKDSNLEAGGTEINVERKDD